MIVAFIGIRRGNAPQLPGATPNRCPLTPTCITTIKHTVSNYTQQTNLQVQDCTIGETSLQRCSAPNLLTILLATGSQQQRHSWPSLTASACADMRLAAVTHNFHIHFPHETADANDWHLHLPAFATLLHCCGEHVSSPNFQSPLDPAHFIRTAESMTFSDRPYPYQLCLAPADVH